MSGIAGVFGAADRAAVQTMLEILRHRGPDASHLVVGEDFVIGATQHDLGGLARERQPLANEAGTVWASLDGELVNYADLRGLLERSGHRFQTSSEVEMLPHLYEEHGLDLCRWLDGRLAGAFYDVRLRRGILVRDRVGEKPLFYLQLGERLYFASEIKALLRVPGFTRRVRPEAVHHFLALHYVPGPETIFEGIRQVPPAHELIWLPGREVELRRYWTPEFTRGSRGEPWSIGEACDVFLDLLRNAVQCRLGDGDSVGYLLGGGLASGLVTALAAELALRRIHTFTLVPDGRSSSDDNERRRQWATWIAKRYGAEHHEERVAIVDFPRELRRVLCQLDQPFVGGVTAHRLARFAGARVRVAMTGTGADELLGGRTSHRLAATCQRTMPTAGLPGWKWRASLSCFNDNERLALFHPDIADHLHVSRTDLWWRDQFERATGDEPLQRLLDAEFRTLLPDQVLASMDRLSMAHGLELRTPFLDTRLVQFLCRLPSQFKNRANPTSFLLERAAERYFPSQMVANHCDVPTASGERWKLDGLRDYVRDTLAPSRLERHGLFQTRAVEQLLNWFDGTPSLNDTITDQLCSLLAFQEWHDLYIDTPAIRGAA
jgi:asparagine synthase (glutamine-hydrolysing)